MGDVAVKSEVLEPQAVPAGDPRPAPAPRGPAPRLSQAFLLKTAMFATGMAGLVAEYVMSTMASYLLGNAVLQWALTVSLMLFAMGVGSRVSRYIGGNLLDAFVWTELLLSVVCATSAASTYLLSAYTQSIGVYIYAVAFLIGLLVGIEIPLVTRLNEQWDELRVNISTIMEKDYYGALAGGLLFAFVALPKLGLTYTPIVLGAVNFAVAALLFWMYRHEITARRRLTAAFVAVPVYLALLAVFAEPITLYGEQRKYVDRIVYAEQTPYQRIVVTRWKQHHWLYLDSNEQFSSYDEERYHEPLVHPAMQLAASRRDVLVLGGGDGLAIREILKYPDVRTITLVDLDPAMTRLASTHEVFTRLNGNSLRDPRVRIVNQDAGRFLAESDRLYDVIVIDLPDPKTVDLARLYTRQFYFLARRHLSAGGTMVTQAASPFFSRQAFLSILKTMRAAGVPAVGYHNHVPTMGEWGWVLGMNAPGVTPEEMEAKLRSLPMDGIPLRFMDQGAMQAMLSFGKGGLRGVDSVRVNDELDLSLFHYYDRGDWDLY